MWSISAATFVGPLVFDFSLMNNQGPLKMQRHPEIPARILRVNRYDNEMRLIRYLVVFKASNDDLYDFFNVDQMIPKK